MVSVGGFFASLKLVTDENSFRQGIGVLEKFPSKLKGLAVGAAGLAAGMVALATSTATAMTKLDAQARTLGMSARTLDNWRGAVGLAGGDADSFVSSMVNMNEAFRNLKIGEVKTDFITATGMSGADFSKLQGMNNDQRLRTIWSALDRVADTQKQQALREKIFGAGGVELASLLQAKGTSLFGLYNQAASLNPLSDADYASAIEGDKKQREIAQALEKTFQNLGIKIEQALLPALTKLAEWFGSHQKELDDFATAVGNATSSVIAFFGLFFKNNEDQQKSVQSFLLGGDKQAKAFSYISALKGIKSGTVGEFGLLVSPQWHRLSEALKKSNVPDDQLSKILGSNVRSTLLESGRSDLAYKLSEDAARVLQETAARRFQALFPGLGKPDPENESYRGLIRSQVTEATKTLKIEISSDGKITDAQAKLIGDTIVKSGAVSGLK